MFFIFYGPEGSGKSTQAIMLAKEFRLPYLGSGDLVRKYAKEDKGVMGEVCKEALRLGHYVADSEMFVLWKHRLKEPDVEEGWVLDGFPRNINQVEFLQDKLNKYGKKITLVFYLKVRERVSIERLLKRGRCNPDGELHDSDVKIRERLRLYKKSEVSVLDFYKKEKVLVDIDGERQIPVIFKDICQRIEKRC